VLGAAVAVAAGLIVATLVWRSQQPKGGGGDQVLLVAERGSASIEGEGDDGTGAARPAAADAGVGTAATVDAGGPAAAIDAGAGAGSRPRPPPGGDPLAQAFARRQGQVATCFTDHAATVIQAPSLKLRFEIDVNGVPTKVEVFPADLGNTPLGACIAAVGRGTRFPRQTAPAAFSIPVSVRASGGKP
jgi:hypothetical protein